MGIAHFAPRCLVAGFVIVCSALLTGCGSVPTDRGFATKSLELDGKTYNYSVFVPHDYTPQQKKPVVMFLHGVLQAGSDGKECTKVGLGQYIDKNADSFPFIAVFPQSPGDWAGDERAKIAIACLDHVQKDYATDSDRVVLTGLSNGGTGTWSVAARFPDRFSALVPMCAQSDTGDVPKLKALPIWCFHNSVDPFIGSGNTDDMVRRLKEAGANVKFTKYGTFGHDCWTQAYSEPDLFPWMLAQRRSANGPAKASASRGGAAGDATRS